MGLSVNTNTAAMNAYRNLSNSNEAMGKSLERLSSGFRINRAADDAAGLAISEGLRSQIGGLTQAVRNTQDGTSVVQTAEGALDETTSILQRMRDLSVQASSDGSLNADAKGNIQKEMTQLKSELTRISTTTNFNGTNLLDGSYSGTFQVGANAGQTITVKIGQGQGLGAAGLGVDSVDVTGVGKYASATSGSGAGTVVTTNATTSAAATVKIFKEGTAGTNDFSGASGSVAAYDNLSGTISLGGKTFDLSSVDYSSITSTGTAGATAALAALNTAAANALGLASTATPFAATSAGQLTFTTPATTGSTDANGYALSASASDIDKATPVYAAGGGASAAISAIDKAIKTVSSQRADLGAIQNRFDHTINNLNTAIENTTSSESRIRDTDMASEMTNYTSKQVLIQAGTAMLAQANQSTQSILKLLQG